MPSSDNEHSDVNVDDELLGLAFDEDDSHSGPAHRKRPRSGSDRDRDREKARTNKRRKQELVYHSVGHSTTMFR